MSNFPIQGRWKGPEKASWLLLIMVVLLAALLLPQTAFAQDRQIDLTLKLVSHRYRIDVTAGKDNNFFLEVNNIGNLAITGIKLSADEPEGWVVEFNPANIDRLAPGSLQTVDVNIRPPGNISGGERVINFIADANEIRKAERIWVTAKLASSWVWVGVIGVLIVVAIFALIFVRYGRQRPSK